MVFDGVLILSDKPYILADLRALRATVQYYKKDIKLQKKSLFLSKSKGIISCLTKTYFIDMNRSFYKPFQNFG